MTYDDFEDTLRAGLATLAREAVPEMDVVALSLPPVRDLPGPRHLPRRSRVRLIAAALVLVVAVVGPMAAFRDDRRAEVVTPDSLIRPVSPSPLQPRTNMVAVATPSGVVIWGGKAGSDAPPNVATPAGPNTGLNDGAVYDPATDSWRAMSASPLSARVRAVAVWTGEVVLIVGGNNEPDGAAYDPATDTWTSIADAPTCPTMGVWMGSRLVVGGDCTGNDELDVRMYDPATDQWSNPPDPHLSSTLLNVGGRLVAWHGWYPELRGQVYDDEAEAWLDLPEVPAQGTISTSAALPDRGTGTTLTIVVRYQDDISGHLVELLEIDTATPDAWTHLGWFDDLDNFFGNADVNDVEWSGDTVAWAAAWDGLPWYRPGTRAAGVVNADEPVYMRRIGHALVALDDNGHFLVWGGQLGDTNDERANRAVADGAVVDLR